MWSIIFIHIGRKILIVCEECKDYVIIMRKKKEDEGWKLTSYHHF